VQVSSIRLRVMEHSLVSFLFTVRTEMPLDTWAFGPEKPMYVLLRVDSGYSTSDGAAGP